MEYFEEFENESLIGKGFIKKGKKEGLWSYFYDTGELKKEVEYINGIEHGKYKFFGKNGSLLFIGFYVNGSFNGEACEYYENGQLKETGEYRNNDFFPRDFWDREGNQLLINGTGKRIQEYGESPLLDVYEQYYEGGEFIKEVKIKGYTVLGFTKKKKD
jgi:antitoxin component YwqK of YwqJK toxin-antitoxin module